MRILHPTDFSSTAEKALALARDLKQRLDGDLHIMHVQHRFESSSAHPYLQPQLDNLNPELTRRLEEGRKEELDRLRNMLEHLASPDATSELRWGDSVRELLDVAAGFDVLVMGAHGANRLDNYFLGGIAGRLVRRSPAPIITVRDEVPALQVRRVLVATDFGDASRHAWEFSRRLARSGIKLVVAHVLDDARVRDNADYMNTVTDALDALVGDVAERHLVLDGNPAQKLPEAAAEVGADVIAIGVRRHSSAVGLLLGSRADMLIRSSPVPILSVPHVHNP
jgi:nucleotide-binding universal stress UspA family protein